MQRMERLVMKYTRMNRSQLPTILVAFALILIVTGCSAELPNNNLDIKTPACTALAALRDSAAGLGAVDANTRIEDLRGRKQGVDRLAEALRRANEVLQSEQITGALGSYDNLSSTIDGAMNQETLGDAAVAVQSGANAIVAALEEARAGLACSQ